MWCYWRAALGVFDIFNWRYTVGCCHCSLGVGVACTGLLGQAVLLKERGSTVGVGGREPHDAVIKPAPQLRS